MNDLLLILRILPIWFISLGAVIGICITIDAFRDAARRSEQERRRRSTRRFPYHLTRSHF